MKTFYSSVVELRQRFDADAGIHTHPYECGWANEAIFFVELHEPAEGTTVSLRVQLSADGIRWLDEGSVLEASDSAFVRLTHFGGFLRLAGTATDRDGRPTAVTASVRLALKG